MHLILQRNSSEISSAKRISLHVGCFQNQRKKLTFLTAEKRNELTQRIISEKQVYAQDFKLHFSNSYQAYLDHYPEKKIIVLC